jgi:hypothetical protein
MDFLFSINLITVNITNTNCINMSSTTVSKYAPHIEITYSDTFENPTFIAVTILGVGSRN